MALVATSFVACKKNDETPAPTAPVLGSLTYNSKTYQLDSASAVLFPSQGYTVLFLSNVGFLKIYNEDPSQKYHDVNIYFASSGLVAGTFTFNNDSATFNAAKNFFAAYVDLDYDVKTDTGTSLEATSGTVTITKTDDTTYSITYELVMDDGKKITGSFKGVPNGYRLG
ncbi:hypothetical protein FLA_1164 [Filimonas lacunae]|nr:hypothetical protein FLA_1164 [Filimonas lacunae]